MFYTALIISLIVGYLLGSFNISIIIGKIKGDDIRNHGSGNAGATNSLRTYGKKVAAIVLLGDFLKAVFAVLLGALISKLFLGADAASTLFCKYLGGLGAVLGHNFPLYFGFRGGKGIITSVGFIFMIDPMAGAVILAVGVLVIAFSRYVSLGSVCGAVAFPLYVILTNYKSNEKTAPFYIALSVVMACLAIIKHRTNIKRLISGTESKLGQKSK